MWARHETPRRSCVLTQALTSESLESFFNEFPGLSNKATNSYLLFANGFTVMQAQQDCKNNVQWRHRGRVEHLREVGREDPEEEVAIGAVHSTAMSSSNLKRQLFA